MKWFYVQCPQQPNPVDCLYYSVECAIFMILVGDEAFQGHWFTTAPFDQGAFGKTAAFLGELPDYERLRLDQLVIPAFKNNENVLLFGSMRPHRLSYMQFFHHLTRVLSISESQKRHERYLLLLHDFFRRPIDVDACPTLVAHKHARESSSYQSGTAADKPVPVREKQGRLLTKSMACLSASQEALADKLNLDADSDESTEDTFTQAKRVLLAAPPPRLTKPSMEA